MNQGQIINNLPSCYPIAPVFDPNNQVQIVNEPDEPNLLVYDEPDLIFRYELPELRETEFFELINPYVQNLVTRIHRGRVPTVDENGNLVICKKGADIHHIIKQEYFRRVGRGAVHLNPFYSELDFLFRTIGRGGGARNGHYLSNLIWLSWELHHDVVHGKGMPTTINTIFGEYKFNELFFAFTLFNTMLCIDDLRKWLSVRKHKKTKLVKSLQSELDAIEVVSKKFRRKHPDLYRVWQHYILEANNLAQFEQ